MHVNRGSAAWRRIAVCVDGSQESIWALQEAVGAARSRRAPLTLISVAPRPWPTIGMGSLLCPVRLADDMTREAADTVRRLAASLPADVSCTTYARSGGTSAILEILRAEPHDVLFVTSRPAGALTALGGRWALRRLLRHLASDVIVLRDGGRRDQGSLSLAPGNRYSDAVDAAGLLPEPALN